MKCLRKYKWVKLPRKEISKMKGRMGFRLRLAEQGYKFDVADAWLDLWCHTVFRDYGNAFSFLSPVVQYGKYGSMLTLETKVRRLHPPLIKVTLRKKSRIYTNPLCRRITACAT